MKKNIVITGASSGIGFQTAYQLAKLGHQILITGRNETNAKKATAELIEKSKNQDISYVLSDLSTLSGMEKLLTQIPQKFDAVDVFINNVGGLFEHRKETEDGLEQHLAINHIVPAILLERLKPLFRQDGKARYISLTTSGHRFMKPNFEDYQSEKKFYGFGAYNKSKSYNLLYNMAVAEAYQKQGVAIIAADPGGAKTSMTNRINANFVPPIMKPMMFLMKNFGAFGSVEKAAKSAVFAATSLELEAGFYISPGPKIGKAAGYVYKVSLQQESMVLTEKIIANLKEKV